MATEVHSPTLRVRIRAFARIRELLDASEVMLDVDPGSRVRDVVAALARATPSLQSLLPATRVARNGRIGSDDERVEDGDELALLPPVGGG